MSSWYRSWRQSVPVMWEAAIPSGTNVNPATLTPLALAGAQTNSTFVSNAGSLVTVSGRPQIIIVSAAITGLTTSPTQRRAPVLQLFLNGGFVDETANGYIRQTSGHQKSTNRIYRPFFGNLGNNPTFELRAIAGGAAGNVAARERSFLSLEVWY